MVRPAPRSTQQLDEAGSLDENIEHSDVYCSGGAISDQQMKHLKMTFEIEKKRHRVLELELQLEKLSTTHNLKVLLNAVCKAAAVISSVISGLLTAVYKETAVISDSLIDNLFIDEEIQPELQNTLNFSELTVESDDSSTSTRDITIVRESTVGESSVRDSLEDLLTDFKITVLPILKNLTHAKAFME
ncbi:hypothetical protein BDDG_13258 [Blastomyces dermatitidis ATCC 18188]|uniref:Uncharacterized protein n=1 Tax=Ajellomyces dermatitidis (strain ATCC 18188 / CBS 674.68) TaxID=653446 RepID=A0A0J9EV92_AJEDA|nr:hypothetical protein BDDG_13258 [Blastomyces dermatitidis ATCC 18188]